MKPAPGIQSNLHHVMELAIIEYDQVAGPLGDNEVIHTIIYYTKMYRLQSIYIIQSRRLCDCHGSLIVMAL